MFLKFSCSFVLGNRINSINESQITSKALLSVRSYKKIGNRLGNRIGHFLNKKIANQMKSKKIKFLIIIKLAIL